MAKTRKKDRQKPVAGRPESSPPGLSAKRRPASPAGRKRFLLEKLLGSGGICEVHAALDLRRLEWGDANAAVAVKRLKPAMADNAQARLALAQEFFVLRHLAHSGVVRVFDIHTESYGVCFSMELLEGRTSQAMLAGRPNGLGASAAPLGFALFDALSFLHTNGVIHGDIKPSNIFLAPEGRLVLMDFNVAVVQAPPGAACSPVAQGLRESLNLPSYSLRYASPERLQGGTPSMADDVYAACCSLYEILAGQHPFGRRSSLEARQEGVRPQRPGGLTSSQWLLLNRGLSFEPGLRPYPESLRACFSHRGLFSGFSDFFELLRGGHHHAAS